MDLDERGCPIFDSALSAAPHCPPEKCQLCTHTPANGIQTSWEWCQENDTCAATIDWDKVYEQA